MSKSSSNFTKAKHLLTATFENNPKPSVNKRVCCINSYCYHDSESALLYVWEANSCGYEHTKQDALMNTEMMVNGKLYPINSPYCCECFKKFVLPGDNNKVSQHYGDYIYGCHLVNVTFNDKPSSSTWYNEKTQQVEPLDDWQVSMLSKPVDYADTSYRYTR